VSHSSVYDMSFMRVFSYSTSANIYDTRGYRDNPVQQLSIVSHISVICTQNTHIYAMYCGIHSENLAFLTDIIFYIVLYIDMMLYIEYSKYI